MKTGTPTCRCGSISFEVAWQTFSDGTRHLRRTCASCGAFGGYQSQGKRAHDAQGGEVLSALEEALLQAISEDDELPEWVAAKLCDSVMTAFEDVRQRYGIEASPLGA